MGPSSSEVFTQSFFVTGGGGSLNANLLASYVASWLPASPVLWRKFNGTLATGQFTSVNVIQFVSRLGLCV